MHQEARAQAIEGIETPASHIGDSTLRGHFRQAALLRLPALD